MAFRPFGDPVDLTSTMRPETLKTAVRARLVGWFDPGSGARGWIMGPVLCLWRSAYDRNGPMLIARIVEDGFGSRVRGRVGSDLNGTALCLVLALVTSVAAGLAWRNGDAGAARAIIVFLVLISLLLWSSHAFRRDADPLIRFLKATIAPEPTTTPDRIDDVAIARSLELSFNGKTVAGTVSAQAISDAVQSLTMDEFLILSEGPEAYMQILSQGDGFLLEHRDGGRRSHVRARDASGSESLSRGDVLAALLAWAADRPLPQGLSWHR